MKQHHQGVRSIRKPDVVLVSAADVECDGSLDGLFEAAAKKPQKKFSWRDVRTVIEFKFSRGVKSPLLDYTNDKYIDPPRLRKYLVPKPSDDESESAIIPPSSSLQETEHR